MEEVFKSFCSFGADKGAHGTGGSPQMEGAKFAKLAKDLKLIDKNLTLTDVDIIFSKVKPKNERKITFAQFKEAVKLMATKKFPSEENAFDKLSEIISQGKGPAVHGVTKTVKSGAVDRLTDTSKYTGSHKERFDDEGKGKGISGREYVKDESGYVSGYKEQGTYDKKTEENKE